MIEFTNRVATSAARRVLCCPKMIMSKKSFKSSTIMRRKLHALQYFTCTHVGAESWWNSENFAMLVGSETSPTLTLINRVFIQALYDKKRKPSEEPQLIKRRIIVCNEIAESSFSTSDVSVVIDCGINIESVRSYKTKKRNFSFTFCTYHHRRSQGGARGPGSPSIEIPLMIKKLWKHSLAMFGYSYERQESPGTPNQQPRAPNQQPGEP